MVAKMLKVCLSLALLGASVPSMAQQPAPPPPPPPAGAESTKKEMGGPRKQLATIIFAGLGGAILGLSTLSFYGRPQDKLANIAIGFAFGVIAGTGYVTYKAANNPTELYGTDARPQLEPEASRFAMQDAAAPRWPIAQWAIHF